jgi:hypothetical protein
MSRAIFLSGPMRGITDLNFPAFNDAEESLHNRFPKAKIFNPARCFGGDQSRDLRDYLAADFTFLLAEADSIAFLPGWEGSEGALIEHAIARAISLDFGFVEPMGDEHLHLANGGFCGAAEWPEHAPVAYEAHRLVHGDRGASYGHPAANFQDIAEAWNVQLGTNSIDATEVADMMTLFKVARGKHAYKRDNVIDAIGYQIAKQRVVDGK